MTTGVHPTVGRAVHFYGPKMLEPLPAVITRVCNNTYVDLVVFGGKEGPAHEQVSIGERDRPLEGAVSDVPMWCWPVIS